MLYPLSYEGGDRRETWREIRWWVGRESRSYRPMLQRLFQPSAGFSRTVWKPRLDLLAGPQGTLKPPCGVRTQRAEQLVSVQSVVRRLRTWSRWTALASASESGSDLDAYQSA